MVRIGLDLRLVRVNFPIPAEGIEKRKAREGWREDETAGELEGKIAFSILFRGYFFSF